MNDTVLGRLALRFTGHPENLATEALAFLLESPVASAAVRRLLASAGVDTPTGLRFQTQVTGEEGEIPDVVGTDAAGVARIVMEAKFWAELTPNQPVTYLRGVAGVPPRVLLFIVPRLRFETVWPELVRRCRLASISLADATDLADFRYAATHDGVLLAMVSWAALLDQVRGALSLAGEDALAGDARQLEGLAFRMDTTAPRPFSAGFLSSEEPARSQLQLLRLVNEATERVVAERLASTQGLKATSTFKWSGRYLKLGKTAALLAVNLDLWARHATSPIWLSLCGHDWKATGRLERTAVQELPRLAKEPSRLDANGKEAVPIFVKPGVEWAEVVDDVYEQLREIHTCLATVAATALVRTGVGDHEPSDQSGGA